MERAVSYARFTQTLFLEGNNNEKFSAKPQLYRFMILWVALLLWRR